MLHSRTEAQSSGFASSSAVGDGGSSENPAKLVSLPVL